MARSSFFPSFQSKFLRALLLFFTLCLLVLQCNAISDDGKILIRIKERDWTDKHNVLNWNDADADPCRWIGVFCNIPFNVVTKVNISHTSIKGRLTSDICGLPNLTELILHSNHFEGPFPDGLLACKHLKTLDLSSNLFGGKLPLHIHKLGELRRLSLDDNSFSGDIAQGFGMLPKLEKLSLTNNHFTGSIPAFLGNLTHLQQLWLQNCSLEGKIPSSLGNLTELESLRLSENHLRGNIPASLMRLTKMRELHLWKNQLSGQIPHNIGQLSSIRFLDFSSNQLNGRIPETIGNLSHLGNLHLWDNRLTGFVPAQLGMLANLTSLDLSSNKLTGLLPQDLGTHSPIWLLDVSENNLIGPLPRNLCKGRNLYGLAIFSNNFNGSLESLDSCSSSLLFAQLYQNQLSGEVPLALWSSQIIVELMIYTNKFQGHIPVEIGGAKELQRLEMANNRFSGIIPPHIGQLSKLINFSASNNKLQGPLPEELIRLPLVNSIELDHNLLSGEIPKGNISLGQLTILNLANNRLKGEIPAWLGSVSNLHTLDLSNNLLVGGIPPELGKLRLHTFNVSGNHLSGSIQSIFKGTAYKDSFLGNPDLCGVLAFQYGIRSCSSKNRDLHHYLPIILVSVLMLAMAIILFLCFITNSRGKPTSSTLRWEVTYFHYGLQLSEGYILQQLTEENVIGSGGSGKVYKVTLQNGQEVAVKRIMKNKKEFEAEVETQGLIRHTNEFEAEVEIQGLIRHANILKLLCCISNAESDFKLLVFEYIQNGSLFECLHGGSESMGALLEWPVRQNIVVGVARGLFYLHNDCSPPILHGDVKSSNILLDSELGAKITNFGVEKKILPHHHQLECGLGDGLTISGFTGSHGYIAPEYSMGLKMNEKSDVYSFGVVILELVTGKRATGEVEYGESLDIVGWIRSKIMSREREEWGVVLQHEEEQGILDSRILQAEDGSSGCREKMLCMLRIGLMCTSSLPDQRPSMRQVLKMLQPISTCHEQLTQ